MGHRIRRSSQHERGATAVEYALVAGLIAVVAKTATWEEIGKSGNYRWECPKGTSLGYNSIEKNTPKAPADAPACT